MTLVAAGDTDPLTDYERRALQELYDWKHPPHTWRARAADTVEDAIERLAARLPTGFLDEMLERGMPVLNRAANMTAPEALVLAAYRRKGPPAGPVAT